MKESILTILDHTEVRTTVNRNKCNRKTKYTIRQSYFGRILNYPEGFIHLRWDSQGCEGQEIEHKMHVLLLISWTALIGIEFIYDAFLVESAGDTFYLLIWNAVCALKILLIWVHQLWKIWFLISLRHLHVDSPTTAILDYVKHGMFSVQWLLYKTTVV